MNEREQLINKKAACESMIRDSEWAREYHEKQLVEIDFRLHVFRGALAQTEAELARIAEELRSAP